jgi:hypothetical protein
MSRKRRLPSKLRRRPLRRLRPPKPKSEHELPLTEFAWYVG